MGAAPQFNEESAEITDRVRSAALRGGFGLSILIFLRPSGIEPELEGRLTPGIVARIGGLFLGLSCR